MPASRASPEDCKNADRPNIILNVKLDTFVFRFCCWPKGHVLSISEPDQQTPRPLLSKSAMWWPRQWPHFKARAQFVSLERFSKNLEMQSLSSPLSRFVMRPLTNPFSRLRFWFGLFIFHLGLPFRRRAKNKTQARKHAQCATVCDSKTLRSTVLVVFGSTVFDTLLNHLLPIES